MTLHEDATEGAPEVREFSDATRRDFLRVAGEYLSGWPYSRPLDPRLLDHWLTLDRFQPHNVRIAYRDGHPVAFLHGEIGGKTAAAHLLGLRRGAVEEGRWLLGEFERRVRAEGLDLIYGPYWGSGVFYGGYVLGQETCVPSWDGDGVCAFVRAGYRILITGVLMVRELRGASPVVVDPLAEGYEIVPVRTTAEFDAEAFGYHAMRDGRKAAHCYARLYPRLEAPRGGTVGQLGNVTTEEAHRGKGLARVMAQMCLRDLQRMGASEALIATGLTNDPALRAYERAGFRRMYSINMWSKELKAGVC